MFHKLWNYYSGSIRKGEKHKSEANGIRNKKKESYTKKSRFSIDILNR